MNIKDLQEKIRLHGLWLRAKEGGERADLSGANLSGANLRGANLSRADLSWANLSGANLSWANLSWANLSGANLRGANLSWANLSRADLSWANLSRADLSGANLSWANLSRADLSGANLSWANLLAIKVDLHSILDLQLAEVQFLQAELAAGRVNGSTYSDGECGCLVGTLAKAAHVNYDALPRLRPDAGRPAERWFLAIRRGDTPENSAIAKITAEWIDEWIAANPVASEPAVTA